MNREDIICMAREAGFNVDEKGAINDGIETAADFSDELERFADLVAAAERREWAKEFAGLGEWTCVHIVESRGAL